MTKKTKRQVSKGIAEGTSSNTLQKLSHPQMSFVKCPVNVECIDWRVLRLYVKYLDLKAQNPDCGTFKKYYDLKYYERTIKSLVAKGWAWKVKSKVYLKAYQAVWRSMGVPRLRIKGVLRFRHFKIKIEGLSAVRGNQTKGIKGYLYEIETIIRKQITKRKQAQIRYALKREGKVNQDQVTFSAKSASLLFGYRSTSTGSKLRQKYFEVIPQSLDESKPKFNIRNGRFEEPTKKIAI